MLISTAATWSDSAPSRRLFCNNPVRRKRNDTSCSAFRCRDGVRRRSTQKRHRLSVVPLERATRISPKRRLRRIQRGEIEEAAGELPAKAGKATVAATVCADGARKKAPPFGGAFGAGDEDFAEAPPAADTARRNRGRGGRIARKGGQGDHCRDGERRRSTQKRHRLSAVPLERATRLELATSTLARWRSTR